MDRSQQGVAPRTCLSKLPVKPRPSPSTISPQSTGGSDTVAAGPSSPALPSAVPARKPVPASE